MTAISSGLDPGKALHGVRQIVRFNWPFYALGIPAAIATPLIIGRLSLDPVGSAVLHGAAALAWFWIAASLMASWLIYDRSPLMSGTWILRALGDRPGVWITIHAGFDETSDGLRRVFGSSGRAFDIYDAAEMTESSIARARRAAGSRAESADYRHLPVPSDSLDAAMVLLSAHELRSDGARTALFREVNRALAPHGRVVVAEHLRDLPNFLAFGPGFLHFFPRRAWIRCFERARLTLLDEFSITPFVRVFVLIPGGFAPSAFARVLSGALRRDLAEAALRRRRAGPPIGVARVPRLCSGPPEMTCSEGRSHVAVTRKS